jgi:ABC-2 type transport system ATP-binding protein
MSENNNKAVVVENIEKRFGDFVAVNRISFDVAKGEIFGFLGPNGAGKSTTIRMLCGILTPSGGSGTVGGFNILRQQEKIKQNIGYMSQRFSLYEDLTVEENIDFYSGIYRIPKEKKKGRKEWIIKMADLAEARGSLTRTLSVGWKQRLALGCAIIHEPPIIFLDEPTSGVDPIARQHFWQLIKEMAGGGVTVFVTTHYMDEAENCDRMALIYKGAIIAMGTPKELKTNMMKYDVIRISVAQSQELLEPLRHIDKIMEAALFGSDIHAVVSDSQAAISEIERMLREKKIEDYKVEKIQASLEDVFVSLIEDYDRATTNDKSQEKNA